jgi:hypothetical protein
MPREASARQPLCADIDGFSLHAAGQVEFELKTPWRDGTTHLVMSLLDFMQRLAALVPRARLHLIRSHGILAPNAKLRALVVPQERAAQAQPATDCRVRSRTGAGRAASAGHGCSSGSSASTCSPARTAAPGN